MAERFLSTREVMDVTGMGRTTLWRLEREGEFPRRRRIVGHRVGWLESEVDEWIAARPVASAADAA
jgi:prophage regulatory protein